MCPNGAVYLPAGNLFPGGNSLFHEFYAEVACVPNGAEHFLHAVRWRLTDEARPGDVVIDGIRNCFLAPNIKQYKVSLANGGSTRRGRRVMGIRAVGIHGYNRWVIGDQVLSLKSFADPTLNLEFVSPTTAHPAPDFLKRSASKRVYGVAGCEVGLDLFLGPRSLKQRDQIA